MTSNGGATDGSESDPAGNALEPLTTDECLFLIRDSAVGRIGFVVEGRPFVLPINFRLIGASDGAPQLVLRTRPGNIVDAASGIVALEVDAFDARDRTGWSVLLQGELRHVDADYAPAVAALDPDPWLDDRGSWLIIDPDAITGRRLAPADVDW
jgi:uncharacterized protein